MIYDWFDDGSKGIVYYSPYLTSPDTTAPISPSMNVVKSVVSSDIQLTWDPNPELDIAGYKIYYGSPTGYSFSNVIDVGTDTSYILTGVSIFDTIAVTAYDIHADGVDDQVEGHESWFATASTPEFIANFTADVTAGIVPLTVHFTDLSVGDPTTWAWDFENDGTTDSEEQNPSFTYTETGIYSVKLIISNTTESDTLVKRNYINVSEPILVSVDTVNAYPGDIAILPVNVIFPADSTFGSFGISFGGYQGNLELIEVDTSASLIGAAGWMIQVNETDSLLITASAGADDISGEGVLFRLKFTVPDSASGFIPVTILSALFDESDSPVNLSFGGVNVQGIPDIPDYGDVSLNGEVTPHDASLILKYIVDYINLNSQQLQNADVSLDTTVSALDASLILQYYVGLIDTLPTTSGLLLASGDIGMEHGLIQTGQSVGVPLYLSNGDNILAFEGLITFNPGHLTFDNLASSELLDGFHIETNVDSGVIKIAAAGSVPCGERGIFVTLQFTVDEDFSDDQTIVTLQKLRWNEEEIVENVASATLTKIVSIKNDKSNIPDKFELEQNYPNPFNPSTTISYQLPKSSFVKLSIYDINGRLVETLLNEQKNAGYYSIEWNAENVGSGIYFYRIDAGDFNRVKKCLVVK